jgi:hypothetical protein
MDAARTPKADRQVSLLQGMRDSDAGAGRAGNNGRRLLRRSGLIARRPGSRRTCRRASPLCRRSPRSLRSSAGRRALPITELGSFQGRRRVAKAVSDLRRRRDRTRRALAKLPDGDFGYLGGWNAFRGIAAYRLQRLRNSARRDRVDPNGNRRLRRYRANKSVEVANALKQRQSAAFSRLEMMQRLNARYMHQD